MNTDIEYSQLFEDITGWPPHDWQTVLASRAECDSRLIRIPTGLGKTEGVLAAWLFHSVAQQQAAWPRRLVWCLPMRVLVEQTAERCGSVIARWARVNSIDKSDRPRVHVLMGGEDTDRWWLQPERPAVLIGTQDMLLSRALNRGYASGRARWPMEYALLNQDCLWVMDEVQLMDVGLATSAQLQAFRDQDRAKQLRPCYTWWMSATLQPDWLKSVDTHQEVERLKSHLLLVSPQQRSGLLWDIRKPCRVQEIAATLKDKERFEKWVELVHTQHKEAQPDDTGRVTLVIVNRVDDAQALHAALQKEVGTGNDAPDVRLIHSRFRGLERQQWANTFLNRRHCEDPQTNLIVVATQVVEAGVDISATALITELAPWPSLVQRFGRAARYGGTAQVVVVDPEPDDKKAKPYELPDLEAAREALSQLDDVSINALEDFEAGLGTDDEELLQRLYRYDYVHLLTRGEFDELFDTSPDLSGADLDISRFIRSGEERDVYVCWIADEEIEEQSKAPGPDAQPLRAGLCPVPVYRARKWLIDGQALKKGCSAWTWDFLEGSWRLFKSQDCYPGQVVLVTASWGGYDLARGFTGDKRKAKDPLLPLDGAYRTQADAEFADDAQGRDDRSHDDQFKTIATHGRDVADSVTALARQLGLSVQLVHLLEMAGLWHDWGKAHAAFQCNIVLGGGDPSRQDFAKAPRWIDFRSTKYGWPEQAREAVQPLGRRRGFRHELASTIALFEILSRLNRDHDALLGPYRELLELGVLSPVAEEESVNDHPLAQLLDALSADDFNLLAYLVCSHHGKVRGQWQATPHDQDFPAGAPELVGRGLPIRGVRDGDPLPAIELALPDGRIVTVPPLTLHLELSAVGLSSRYGPGWTDRVQRLLAGFGPTTLAYMETLLRVADARGSQVVSADPLLTQGAAL